MSNRRFNIFFLMVMTVFSAISVAQAASVTVTMIKTSGYSSTSFGDAMIRVFSGDVFLGENEEIGKFSCKYTTSGMSTYYGCLFEYFIGLENTTGKAVPDFISIQVSHMSTGKSAGTIIATSPDLKYLLNATVTIHCDDGIHDILTITW